MQRSWASLCRVEFREVVRSIFGTGGDSSVKMVGNLRAREVGVKSRFVLVVDGAVEDARGRRLGETSSSRSSESESSILSASSSCAPSARGSSNIASASSMRRLFSCSTSTLTFNPSSSTSSQTRFLSIV